MKHVTYAGKTLLVGDEIADVLMAYSAALATDGAGEAVDVVAVSGDGDGVIATFLLGMGSPIMVETSTTSMPEPDNRLLTVRLQSALHARQEPLMIQPEEPWPMYCGEFLMP